MPPPPLSLTAVALPDIKEGGDVRVSRYDHRVALVKANSRIKAARKWYMGVRSDYASQK